MKKINWLFTALAGLVLTCCTGEDLSEAPPVVKPPKQDVPILFSFTRGNTTRAENYFTGAEAAKLLGNKFVVTGFKGEKTATPGSIVFDNYLVEYAENTANTTESNSSNWEYVGKTPIAHATTNGITSQTIKYWDYSVDQYDFFAWSTGGKEAVYTGTYDTDQVLVTNIQPNSKTNTWAAASGDDPARIAYTFSGKAEDLAQCYISDLVTVKKGTAGTYGEVSGYDKTVTLKFRQLGTKVRIGIYETVPGYSVKNVKFYTKGGQLDATTEGTDDTPGVVAPGQIVDNATIFSAGADIYKEGTYKVYFPTLDTPADADNNQAHIIFTPKEGATQATTVNWGGLKYTIRESGEKSDEKIYLGRSSNTATFAGDAADNYYKVYLPNETGANLNLRVDFTLESIDGSGETIEVKNAKAQVPSIYTTWKPGFAYTYLFKISDKTNGRTGVYDPTQVDGATINSDPAGLYPITFDAVAVNAEDGNQTQETITTIATPSITTYQNGSNVVNNDEYTVLTPSEDRPEITGDIYVTVNEGDNLVTMTDKAALYTIPDGKTEAEVINALSMQDDDAAANTIKGRSGLVLTNADLTLTNKVEFGVDGNAIDVETDQAAKFTPTANTTYAFVYTKTAATETTEIFQPVTIPEGDKVNGYYRYGLKNAPGGDVQEGVQYFIDNQNSVDEVFFGQTVSNLYLDNEGNTIASGYAVTGTTYYYTIDGGQSYKAAHNVAYADFGTTLYVLNSSNEYKLTSDTTPQNGTAYYYKENDGSYTYCVILPQQTNPSGGDRLKVANTSAKQVACGKNEKAIKGMPYFDMYTKNNGEYYTKVIKVQ